MFLQTTHQILPPLENKSYAAAVFLDVSKAFDSVNHHLLLTTLEELGIRSQLFKNYLADKKIKEKNGECVSEELVMKTGLCSGSNPLI